MKKILISALLVFGIALSASAQGKEETSGGIGALLGVQNDHARGGLNVPKILKTADDSIQAVLMAYNNCETPEEALQYIMDVQRVKPLMMKYYEEVADWSTWYFDEWTPGMRFQRIKANVYYHDFTETHFVKTPSGYKIDWEATVKYNPYTVAQMKGSSNKVFELRARVEKCLDYADDYWVAYNTSHDINCFYAKKTNPHVKKLDKWIKQKAKPVIIKVKWNPSEESFDLVEFVSEGCSKY